MNPRLNQSGPCLIVLAEWKAPVYGSGGLKLASSSVRRSGPQVLDSKIHHNNLLHNILAKIEANAAGADDALMLDGEGYVAETNATNLFLAKRGRLATPLAEHCLPGITRAIVLELARANAIPCAERRCSLMEFHTADEVFTSGTMGELAWVREIDGRVIGSGERGPLTARLVELFASKTASEGEPIPG
jgi:branched-chain amino acid aminotransferase